MIPATQAYTQEVVFISSYTITFRYSSQFPSNKVFVKIESNTCQREGKYFLAEVTSKNIETNLVQKTISNFKSFMKSAETLFLVEQQIHHQKKIKAIFKDSRKVYLQIEIKQFSAFSIVKPQENSNVSDLETIIKQLCNNLSSHNQTLQFFLQKLQKMKDQNSQDHHLILLGNKRIEAGEQIEIQEPQFRKNRPGFLSEANFNQNIENRQHRSAQVMINTDKEVSQKQEKVLVINFRKGQIPKILSSSKNELFRVQMSAIIFFWQGQSVKICINQTLRYTDQKPFVFQVKILRSFNKEIFIGITDKDIALSQINKGQQIVEYLYWGKGIVWSHKTSAAHQKYSLASKRKSQQKPILGKQLENNLDGPGFNTGDIVQTYVSLADRIIGWKVNGILSVWRQIDKDYKKNRNFVPCFEFEDRFDAVNWLFSKRIDEKWDFNALEAEKEDLNWHTEKKIAIENNEAIQPINTTEHENMRIFLRMEDEIND